ncbi:alpha/beta hydrolase [Comamonas flocculans]|nr:alpha/beta hydrolase-fold protein [Comamonas flocculans]
MMPIPTRRALLKLGTLPVSSALSGCAVQPGGQAAADLEHAPPVALPGTRQIDLAAGTRRHRIMLAVPPAPPPAQGWPVLYLLDGDLLFALAAQLMRNRYARGPGGAAPGVLIVGMGHAGGQAAGQVLDLDARSQDYTPPAPGPATSERGRPEGGADAFLDFIDAVVRPMVARAAPVDAARQTFFGHSYGGLCVLHALFTRPGGFQTYVAASPSVWWRGGFIVQEQERFTARRRADACALRLLLTQGAREAAPPADPARAAIARERHAGEHLQALIRGLRGTPGLALQFTSFAGADHGSSMAPAVQQALAWAAGDQA